MTTGSPDPSLAHLLARVDLVASRVRAAVERRRAVDPDPDDPVRGLYVSDAQVDELLATSSSATMLGLPPPHHEQAAAVEDAARRAEDAGADMRLRRLVAAFDLDAIEVELLLAAVAPDIDPRFERLYGYLHDDVTRRRVSVALALELAGLHVTVASGRRRLAPGGHLVDGGLVRFLDADRPLLSRGLRVTDRVTGFLLGDDTPADELAGHVVEVDPVAVPGHEQVAAALRSGTRLQYLREKAGAAGTAVAAAGVAAAGLRALVVDTAAVAKAQDMVELVEIAVNEARLSGRVLVAGPIDGLVTSSPASIRTLATAACPVIVFGSVAWSPGWAPDVPLQTETRIPMGEDREAIWSWALDSAELDVGHTTMSQFRLSPAQAARTATSARLRAAAEDRPVALDDLRAGAREQNAGRLEHLARRVEPRATFDDLVIPPRVRTLLREIVERATHRDRVLGDWRMGGRTNRGRGITSLFAGDSGTGKTLSAEVIAGALGLDLYTIDLSTVVDKYIGETEKNLERIFDEAEGVNGVLFFDEADALFGKRSEVSDAKDRYANVEIAFLLQRMEYFDGIAILATNLRANLDEAFTRRLDVLIDFPTPEEEDRRALWDLHLPAALPRADDVDLDWLAKAFEIAGGDIRNVTLAAAYQAAVEDSPLTMRHLVFAMAREYRKLGRLITTTEFGHHLDTLGRPAD